MTTTVQAMRARAEILEKATVFMDDDEELAEESMSEVQLWRTAADLIEQLEAAVEDGRARATRLAEEIWQMTGERVAIL